MNVNLDFETYSEAPLPKVGAFRYSAHPSTEVLCAAYQIDDQPRQLWKPGDPFPDDLRAALDAGATLRAWNATFEIVIWRNVWARETGVPCPPPERWVDSMAVAAYFGLPQSLTVAGNVTGVKKLESGRRLINMLSMPCKPSKSFPHTRRTPETHPELFEEMYGYCLQDVAAERAVLEWLPRQALPPVEQRIWIENLKANLRGVAIDRPLVDALVGLRDGYIDRKTKRFGKLTGGLAPTQTVAIGRLLEEKWGVELPNLQAKTIDAALEGDEGLPLDVWEILTIRREVAQVASKKLDAMLRYGGDDDTLHDMTVYYGAGTGRFAGRGVQLQNLARGAFPVTHVDRDIFRSVDPEHIPLIYGVDPMTAIGTMIRPCLVPDRGKVMFDADYSAIEARGVAWLAGAERLLRAFRTHGKVYELMATDIFACGMDEIDGDRRFVGKTAILGCGYQAGAPRFYEMCLDFGRDIGIELARHTVETYRTSNPEIPCLWRDANEAFMQAIRNQGRVFAFGVGAKVSVQSTGKYLFCRLPSGRTITYCAPRIEMVEKVFDEDEGPVQIEQIMYHGMNSYTRKWDRNISLYGGKIVENVVQGLCRDLMCHGLLGVIDSGYDFLFTVHDQIVCQRPEGEGSLDEYIGLMTDVPDWAAGFPLDAEGKVCRYFSK